MNNMFFITTRCFLEDQMFNTNNLDKDLEASIFKYPVFKDFIFKHFTSTSEILSKEFVKENIDKVNQWLKNNKLSEKLFDERPLYDPVKLKSLNTLISSNDELFKSIVETFSGNSGFDFDKEYFKIYKLKGYDVYAYRCFEDLNKIYSSYRERKLFAKNFLSSINDFVKSINKEANISEKVYCILHDDDMNIKKDDYRISKEEIDNDEEFNFPKSVIVYQHTVVSKIYSLLNNPDKNNIENRLKNIVESIEFSQFIFPSLKHLHNYLLGNDENEIKVKSELIKSLKSSLNYPGISVINYGYINAICNELDRTAPHKTTLISLLTKVLSNKEGVV